MAYGLRNLSSPYEGLKEAFRILKPGGRAGILDFRSFEGTSIQGLFQKIYLRRFNQVQQEINQNIQLFRTEFTEVQLTDNLAP